MHTRTRTNFCRRSGTPRFVRLSATRKRVACTRLHMRQAPSCGISHSACSRETCTAPTTEGQPDPWHRTHRVLSLPWPIHAGLRMSQVLPNRYFLTRTGYIFFLRSLHSKFISYRQRPPPRSFSTSRAGSCSIRSVLFCSAYAQPGGVRIWKDTKRVKLEPHGHDTTRTGYF